MLLHTTVFKTVTIGHSDTSPLNCTVNLLNARLFVNGPIKKIIILSEIVCLERVVIFLGRFYYKDMTILLLSAYNTASHKHWCNILVSNIKDVNWTFLTLPPRKFAWRIRGNALSWYGESKEELRKHYDVVLATSMVDLSTLIGLFPHLGKAKKILYFHENQFEYPLSEKQIHGNVEGMMVNLYGGLAADLVLFNSEYNRRTFVQGAKNLLKRLNDHSPIAVVDDVVRKSQLLPVPVGNKIYIQNDKIKNSILWTHRWEYDKNPDDLYKSLLILRDRGVDFKLIIMGLQYKDYPTAFDKIKDEFNDKILCWGEKSGDDYHSWLAKGQVIVSTAIHEFQGLSIMEGVQHGAIPIVPNRLSYPEWFPKKFLYNSSPEDMANLIEDVFSSQTTSPDITYLTWDKLETRYRDVLGLAKL